MYLINVHTKSYDNNPKTTKMKSKISNEKIIWITILFVFQVDFETFIS